VPAQEWPLGIASVDYQARIKGLITGAFSNGFRKLADPLIIVRVGIVEAHNRFALRTKPWRSTPFVEFHIGLLVLSVEENGAIIAVLAIFGLLISLTLPAQLVVYDSPHAPLQYRSRFWIISHKSFQVWRGALVNGSRMSKICAIELKPDAEAMSFAVPVDSLVIKS
jgi:hypothetical protein